MKLYTRTGDAGETSLFDGGRVRKDHVRVCAYGDVDELNAQIGVTVAALAGRRTDPAWTPLIERLSKIQNELFDLGADLATPNDAARRDRVPTIDAGAAARLEGWIDDATRPVPEMRVFVLPGGSPEAGRLHVCRTVCRRAERSMVTLAASNAINPHALIYLNRLSDLLFAWARLANHLAGVPDVPWGKGGAAE